MGSRTMPFSTHRGQGGQCTGATVVRLWCLPEDRLGPGVWGDVPPDYL